MRKPDDRKFSCAYIAKDSGEIFTVDVTLGVEKDKMKVIIQPNEQGNIQNDLPEILKQIEKNHLSRVDISIINDCEVYIGDKENDEDLKRIKFIDENFTIKG